jgi:hypothetical protein
VCAENSPSLHKISISIIWNLNFLLFFYHLEKLEGDKRENILGKFWWIDEEELQLLVQSMAMKD